MSEAKNSKRHAIVWTSVIVGLLVMTVIIQGTLLVYALNDPSFAVEPDYEQKAANWDAIREQQAASDRLGWDVSVSTRATTTPGQVEVELTATEPGDAPVVGAVVSFEAFHNARASRIIRGEIPETADGVYGGTYRLSPSGVWEFRIKITRQDDVYTGKFRKSVLSLPRSP